MVRTLIICFIVVAVVGLTMCQKGASPVDVQKPLFDSVPTVVSVNPIITEVSGVADSRKNAGQLFAMEDGGNPTQLFLVNHNGSVAKKIYIKGITNRDWEEMAIAGNDIYIGEIGDNNESYASYAIYKFAEPLNSVDTIRTFESYAFVYPDGSHDAEAFFLEPSTRNIYIITKRDNPSRIYKLTAPLSTSTTNNAVLVGQLNYTGVVGAAMAADGKEMIVKTYLGLGYYKRSDTESVEAALQKAPTILPYQVEPQGEAVCFSASNNGYFTLSEKGFANNVQLYFYKRN